MNFDSIQRDQNHTYTPCQVAYIQAHKKMIAEFADFIPQNDCPSNHISGSLRDGMTDRIRELMKTHLSDGHQCECI